MKNFLYAILTIAILTACSTSENSANSDKPKWAANIPRLQKIIALDGSQFYIRYRQSEMKVDGLNWSLDVLYNSDGDQLTGGDRWLVPINKKLALGCIPHEDNFNRCRFWDLSSSKPKAVENNIDSFSFEKSGTFNHDDTLKITLVRILEKTNVADGKRIYSLRVINPDLTDKVKIENIVSYKDFDDDKMIKVQYLDGRFENFDYSLKSLSGTTEYEIVNGRPVQQIVGADKLYAYYDPQLKKSLPLPPNVLGYQPIFNSNKYFTAAVKTPNGIRYRAELTSGKGADLLCQDIQQQTHFEMGPQFFVIICKNENSEWVSIEVEDKNGAISYHPEVPPNKDYRQLINKINESRNNAQSELFLARKEAECMQLTGLSRDRCMINAGSYMAVRYLIKNPSPDADTIIEVLSKLYVPDDKKAILSEKLVKAVKEKNNSGTYVLGYVLRNINLNEADKKTLSEKWNKAHIAEVEFAKAQLRNCIKTANTWASIKERACARQLGGEDWYVWLESDGNASSKDFVEAIAEAKKIGRDTTKLQKQYEHVKRSEETAAYYADKARREEEEKRAFGNIYTIMKNVRENYATICAQNPSSCAAGSSSPAMDSYKQIMWEQSVKKGGPTWDQINSGGR